MDGNNENRERLKQKLKSKRKTLTNSLIDPIDLLFL